MLSDYIPVYYPETNQWSIPGRELEKYEDYIAEPQEMTLYEGAKIRGIPLIHFGTWGIFGVNVTELIREIAKDPAGSCEKYYKSKKVRKDTAEFFATLVAKYPAILEVTAYHDDKEHEDLEVPAGCIVSRPKRKRS